MRKWRWTLVTVVATATGLLLAGCAAGPDANVVALCNSDAGAVETAAIAYQGQIGSPPTSIRALTRTLVVNGQPVGPWLRAVPSTAHYTIFLDYATGLTYVYPPRASRPASYSKSHNFDASNPCASFAS